MKELETVILPHEDKFTEDRTIPQLIFKGIKSKKKKKKKTAALSVPKK